MSKKKKYIIYLVLAISVILNLITFSFDTYPYLYPKLKNKFFKAETIESIDNTTERKIVDSAMEMINSSRVIMTWDEATGVTQKILSFNTTSSSDEYRKFNYPRAFLFYGITSFASKQNDNKILLETKNLFDDLINDDGSPAFLLDKIDQVPFGLSSIILYNEFGDEKYLNFTENIYSYVKKNIEDNGLLPYRKDQKTMLNDALGMAVPFLVEYSKIDNNQEALEIAKRQLDYYIQFGVDKETFLPSHAINRKSKIKVGPVNWGRGIGWYFLALSNFYKETGELSEEYEGIISTLKVIKNSDNLWSQFPGSGDKFDASTTTLFVYSMLLNDSTLYGKEEILRLLKPYLSHSGDILQTSGDTYGLNRYSNAFGKSEFSQGMLLLILSLYNS